MTNKKRKMPEEEEELDLYLDDLPLYGEEGQLLSDLDEDPLEYLKHMYTLQSIFRHYNKDLVVSIRQVNKENKYSPKILLVDIPEVSQIIVIEGHIPEMIERAKKFQFMDIESAILIASKKFDHTETPFFHDTELGAEEQIIMVYVERLVALQILKGLDMTLPKHLQ